MQSTGIEQIKKEFRQAIDEANTLSELEQIRIKFRTLTEGYPDPPDFFSSQTGDKKTYRKHCWDFAIFIYPISGSL